jgi:hypothetical protein
MICPQMTQMTADGIQGSQIAARPIARIPYPDGIKVPGTEIEYFHPM